MIKRCKDEMYLYPYCSAGAVPFEGNAMTLCKSRVRARDRWQEGLTLGEVLKILYGYTGQGGPDAAWLRKRVKDGVSAAQLIKEARDSDIGYPMNRVAVLSRGDALLADRLREGLQSFDGEPELRVWAAFLERVALRTFPLRAEPRKKHKSEEQENYRPPLPGVMAGMGRTGTAIK